uniref:Nucleotide-diphospho-sugar transferase domain-containing protein n=1 Tax=Alexandrium catenella TaxID=2925 RepID=A0A7S1WGI0_ALECA
MMLRWCCWLASLVLTTGLRVTTPGAPHEAGLVPEPGAHASESALRGDFSRSCALYPGKRVVLVTVNYNYLDFFRNWLHYAEAHLKDTEQLVVMAEDSAAQGPLEAMRESSNVSFVVAEPGAEKPGAGADANETSKEVPKPFNYGSKEYGSLVWRRPKYILNLLRGGCTVLYVDIDTVWTADPFLELGKKPARDMYLISDDDPKGRGDTVYLCTCFMYLQPKRPVKQLMTQWSQSWDGRATKNQFRFNFVLKAMKSMVDFGVLPIDKFPPGVSLDQFPNASIVHANWVNGHAAKKCVLTRRGLWAVAGQKDLESCAGRKR